MKESKQSRSRTLRRILILLAVGAPLIVAVLQYYRVQGFKNTLEYLVNTETDGAFQLTIGHTDIDYFQLSFALNEVAVSKARSDSQAAGVREVTTEKIKVRFGSLWSLWSGKQLQIEELLIREPVAKVGISKTPDPIPSKSQAPVNVAHQIAQFSPAIVSLLNQFDIEFFHIERARMEMDKSENTIEVRLIDLLVANWNMRQLSSESTLRLSLEEQSIDFTTSQFSFGSIVYDYQQSVLEIQDYEFVQNDSLNRPVINATGESLIVANLDFQALIDDERYVLGEIIMKQPAIVVQVYPHKKRENNIKYPLSTLLKRNLRELELEVCNIEDASMDLYLYHQSDTVHVQLPDLDLRSKELVVTEDSSTLMIGSVNLELGNTRFDPGNGLALSFSKLIYDDNYYAEVDNIKLMDNVTGKQLMSSEFLKLFNFNFFHYYYENEIAADSMILKNGNLKTNHGAPRLSGGSNKASKQSPRKLPAIGISKVVLDQMDLDLDFGDRQLQSRQITTIVDNFRRDEGLRYQLRYLMCPTLTYNDPVKQIEVELLDVVYGPRSLKMAGLKGDYHGLSLGLDHLNAQLKHNFTLDEPWHYQLSSVDVNRLELSGQIPVSKNSNPPADMEIQAIAMDTLLVDLELSNGAQLNLQGTQLVIDRPQFIDQKIAIGEVAMDLAEVSLVSDSLEISVKEAQIDNQSMSYLNQLAFKSISGTSVQAKQVRLGPWEKSLDTTGFDHLVLSQLAISLPGVTNVSTIDSIMVQKFILDEQEGPFMEAVEVYAPDIYISAADDTNTKAEKGIDLSPLDHFNKIHIHPGKMSMKDKSVTFNGILFERVDKKRSVDLRDLAFTTPANSFHIGHLWTTAESFNIDTVTVVPTSEFLDQIELEQDIIAGQFYHLQLRQLDWNAFIDSSKIIADDLLIDGFEISIKRDKTLPDPPMEIKPHLVAALLPQFEGISIPKIVTSNGNITYLEVGDKTGEEGRIRINNINATLNRNNPLDQPEEVLRATAKLYEKGAIEVAYDRLDSSRFSLKVDLTDFPAEQLNEMVDPLEAAKIESGIIESYQFQVMGDDLKARGKSIMTYDDLHVRIFKRGSPDQRNLGSDLLTLLVDHVILKHSKTNVTADFSRNRIQHKGPFNYWAKISIEGAIAAIKKGKKEKKSKR